MATYNGERYVREQINSIIGQTYTDWSLFISDDGSVDNTIEIIEEYSRKFKNIYIVPNKKNRGCKDNFMYLLSLIDSDLYMFSDQDDFWLPNKIEESIFAYDKISNKHQPILIHSDASIVDKNLNILFSSYWEVMNIEPSLFKTVNYLSLITITQGATLLFNQKCKECAFPISRMATMHDSWIAIQTIRKCGKIKSIYKPLLLYRQHENNVLGVAVSKERYSFSNKIVNISRVLRVNIDNARRLKKMGYGGFLKYFFYKTSIIFKRHFKLITHKY